MPLLVALVVLASSCGVTRRIPQGSYMLKSNKIEIDRNVPRQERITYGELDRYVVQSTNRHFLGTNLYPWLHAQADPAKDSWWHRLLRGAGEEPVVWDAAKTERSRENIGTYIASRGLFAGEVRARVDTLRRSKVRVTYSVEQGPAWRLGRIGYLFRDSTLAPLVMADSARTLLHTGDAFDTGVMDRERMRITALLRSRGYWDFNANHITYVVDSVGSAARGRTIDVEMTVRRNVEGFSETGTPIYADHLRYRLGRVEVRSDYDPMRDGSGGSGSSDGSGGSGVEADTLRFGGLDIIYHGEERVRASILRRSIALHTDSLYSAADATATSAELMRLGAYRSVSVLFDRVPGDVPLLNGDIRCVPALRQSVGADVEGSATSNFWGLRTTLSYRNRNLFRGAEMFDASVSSGFEFLRHDARKLSYELSGVATLTFPRFVLWGAERSRKVLAPVSTLSLSAGWQDRAYYSRTLVGIGWGYGWNSRRGGSFTLRPVDVSLVDMGYLSSSFVEEQLAGNPYLKASYNDQLIAGISGSYLFNERPRAGRAGRTLRMNVETTGNLISGLVRLGGARPIVADAPVAEGQPPRKESYYNIFGIRFAQYVRAEGSFSQTFRLGEKTAFAYRVQGGAIHSYGNSDSPPFEKFFFAGGATSMRGWSVRTLGPGTVPYVKRNFPAQVGDVKLEANVELRFPVVRSLGGALFMDAGNIWFMRSRPTEYPDEAVFRVGRFARQLGFDGGVGVRFEVWRMMLRLDWGVQLHSPGRAAGERWIHNFKWENTALSLGVGQAF